MTFLLCMNSSNSHEEGRFFAPLIFTDDRRQREVFFHIANRQKGIVIGKEQFSK